MRDQLDNHPFDKCASIFYTASLCGACQALAPSAVQ